MGHPRCQMNVAPRHVASQVAAASAGVFGEQNQGAAGLGAPCGVWGRRLPLPPSPARSPALAEPRLLDLSPSQAPRRLGHAELSPPVLVQLQWAQPAGGMRCQGDQVWVDAGGRGFSYPPSASCPFIQLSPSPPSAGFMSLLPRFSASQSRGASITAVTAPPLILLSPLRAARSLPFPPAPFCSPLHVLQEAAGAGLRPPGPAHPLLASSQELLIPSHGLTCPDVPSLPWPR